MVDSEDTRTQPLDLETETTAHPETVPIPISPSRAPPYGMLGFAVEWGILFVPCKPLHKSLTVELAVLGLNKARTAPLGWIGFPTFHQPRKGDKFSLLKDSSPGF